MVCVCVCVMGYKMGTTLRESRSLAPSGREFTQPRADLIAQLGTPVRCNTIGDLRDEYRNACSVET